MKFTVARRFLVAVTSAMGYAALLTFGLASAQSSAPPSSAEAPAPTPPRSPYNQDYLKGPPPATPVPDWAFTMDPPATADLQRHPDDDVPQRITGSTLALTRRQALAHNDAIDWHPDDHPPAPSIVMFGHKPQPAACAFCHRPNGAGMPENAPLAGLPYNYFIQQVHDLVDKSRKSADMRMASYHGMADIIGPKITEEDLKTAATYYSGLKLKPYLTVIETTMAPKSKSQQYTLKADESGAMEPIGNRVLEIPKDWRRFDLADSQVGYNVYVPKGSIKKGRVLVTTGGGKTLPCVSCHGADLRGLGDIPPIGGRSPSNLVRQIYNIKVGARDGPNVEPMKPVVANLNDEDIVNIAAYLASRKP